jgi:CRISPR-associated endonuclease/helicase Cas3
MLMDDSSPSGAYIAHPDILHGHHQSVYAHLQAVSELAGRLAAKIRFAEQGQLIG